MHDQDKNILKKYNILCVTVTAKKGFYWGFIFAKRRRAVGDWGTRRENEIRLIKCIALYRPLSILGEKRYLDKDGCWWADWIAENSTCVSSWTNQSSPAIHANTSACVPPLFIATYPISRHNISSRFARLTVGWCVSKEAPIENVSHLAQTASDG